MEETFRPSSLWDVIKTGMEDLWGIVERVAREISDADKETDWEDRVLDRIPLSLQAEIATAVGLEKFSFEGFCDAAKVYTAAMMIAKNYPNFYKRSELVNDFISLCNYCQVDLHENLSQKLERYRNEDDKEGVVAVRGVLYLMVAKAPAEGLIKVLKELSAEDLDVFRGFVDLADVLKNLDPGVCFMEEFEYKKDGDDIGAMGARVVGHLLGGKDAVGPMALVLRHLSADGLTKFITLFDPVLEDVKKLLG